MITIKNWISWKCLLLKQEIFTLVSPKNFAKKMFYWSGKLAHYSSSWNMKIGTKSKNRRKNLKPNSSNYTLLNFIPLLGPNSTKITYNVLVLHAIFIIWIWQSISKSYFSVWISKGLFLFTTLLRNCHNSLHLLAWFWLFRFVCFLLISILTRVLKICFNLFCNIFYKIECKRTNKSMRNMGCFLLKIVQN